MAAEGSVRKNDYNPTLLYRFMLRVVVPATLALWVRMDVEGRENIPRTGPLLVVSNHVDNNDSYVIGRYIPHTLHYLARPAGMRSRVLGRFWRAMAAMTLSVSVDLAFSTACFHMLMPM